MSVPIKGEADGRRYTYETLPASLLEIDPGVQRGLNPSRVDKIAKNFQESQLGTFLVSARQSLTLPGEGEVSATVAKRYVVLDGLHRLAALRKFAGTDSTTLPVTCQVYRGLTRSEEAEMFLAHNDRAAVKPGDRFRLAVVAGDRTALAINAIVTRHGFEVNINAAPAHRFVAVTTAQRIFSHYGGPEALDRAFEVAVRAWNHQTNTASADSIGGLGLLFLRHGEAIDVVGLAARLQRTGNAKQFIGRAAQIGPALGISRAEAAYRAALNVYNHGLKNNRLEPRK